MKCYLVAGEMSGDRLGAGLIAALKSRYPDAEFRGIGGEQMQAAGLTSLYPLESLSIMGIVEVIKHLPRLFRMRRHLYDDALDWQADIMIGVDAPDFNLGLERRLRDKGMTAVHYVSPSVWAWRQWRVKKIARSVDQILAFLPFEADFYRQHKVPVTYVGHPLADALPLDPDQPAARAKLKLEADRTTLAILPGSRRGEVAMLLPDFLATARLLLARYPDLQFVIPAANLARKAQIEAYLSDYTDLPVTLVEGNADTAMTAADLVLITSGTATLEAMLLKRPMVVAYRVSRLTYMIAIRLAITPHVALPNLLADSPLIPEFLQDAATPMALAESVSEWLDHPEKMVQARATFHELHKKLRCDANERAADSIAGLLNKS